jgi:PAS domain S-box-containing protein
LRAVIVAVAYYIALLLGQALVFPSSFLSIIWPPNTILLAALLLLPRAQWTWLLLTILPVHALAYRQFGASLTLTGLFYVYDVVLVLLTASALRRLGVGDLALRDLRAALIFIGVTPVAVALGSLVWSPLFVSLFVGGDPWRAWSQIFLSNFIPFLIATPALVLGASRGVELIRTASLERSTEFSLLTLGLFACAIGVFGLAPQAVGRIPALFYTPLPFLLWAAVRFGPAGLSFSFLIFALMAMFNAIAGYGPFVTQTSDGGVVRLQIFLLALYMPLLVLASVVEERRGKEEALRRSEARYRAVVEDQTELICRFLPDGTYTFVNGAYCRYFQRTPEELLGRSFWEFIPAEGHEAAREFLASITLDHPVATREHEVIAPGGEVRWQHWTDHGFFDDEGRIIDYQAVGSDITHRKRLEEATRQLAHGGRLAVVGELTASIAHEISQPLTAILSNAVAAQRLLESPSPPLGEVREILADIYADDQRASEVIRRIRGLLHRREISLAPLDLSEVADEVVRLVANDARRRKVAVDTAFESGLGPVRGDRIHLQQVLLNLLLNAMDAMDEAPHAERRISVRTARHGNHAVLVSVSDTGHGIPADKLPSVFDSFFTTKEHGMGLGLAIARSIIEVHGGRIWACNNAAGGATFTFTLSATAPHAAAL